MHTREGFYGLFEGKLGDGCWGPALPPEDERPSVPGGGFGPRWPLGLLRGCRTSGEPLAVLRERSGAERAAPHSDPGAGLAQTAGF